MKVLSLYAALLYISTMFLSYSKDAPVAGTPKPGSVRMETKEIEYISGKIGDSESWATWPVAKFKADKNAVSYSVKVLSTGKTYTWNAGKTTAGEFDVYPLTNDIKDGDFYIGLGRTWCSDCPAFDKSWEQHYRSNVFTTSNKVEITIYY